MFSPSENYEIWILESHVQTLLLSESYESLKRTIVMKQQQLHHNAKFFADETGLEFLEDFDSFNFPFQ